MISKEQLEKIAMSEEEYNLVVERLNREPTNVELGMFSALWSEHCGYKHTRPLFHFFPTEGKRVLSKTGEENAGAIDLGDGDVAVFKVESHNHPSAVEPYEGAATGVGGILRDIFAMGMRPIALLDSLRFGDITQGRTKYLLDGVIAGISGYGNCVGVPTVGGEIFFDNSFTGNPLVNVMCVGVGKKDDLVSATAEGLDNPLILVGSDTGRDGIHGATFASVDLSEDSVSDRPAVQVGNPFMEKLLMEACLELMKDNSIISIQDMGAAGLTSSSVEMASKGKLGIELDLSKVPCREEKMTPYEIMLSESQERMLIVLENGKEDLAKKIFDKWNLDFAVIGKTTDSKNIELFFDNQQVANIPVNTLVENSPMYDRKWKKSKLPKKNKIKKEVINKIKIKDVLKKILSNPNICSKEWIYQQYDHTVMGDTIQKPGGDAGVVRVHGTNKAVAASVDSSAVYCWAHPLTGGKQVVCESWRNLISVGATPIAITNCLNFGNPQDPEIYWQFKEAVLGMGEMCRMLDTPVTGGNVSFYNETVKSAVYPTPVIGMVGVLEDIDNVMTMNFKKEGDLIGVIGNISPSLGGSTYLKKMYNKIEGPLSIFSPSAEIDLQSLCLDLINQKIIKSAHDVSDGGLAVALSKSISRSDGDLGAQIYIDHKLRNDELLFGECPSLIIITFDEEKLYKLVLMSQKYDVNTQTIGKVSNNGKLEINDILNLEKHKINDIYNSSFKNTMESIND